MSLPEDPPRRDPAALKPESQGDSRYIPSIDTITPDHGVQTDALSDVARRYSLDKYVFWWLTGLFLLVSFWSAIRDEDYPDRTATTIDRPSITRPAFTPAPANPPSEADAMVTALFGAQTSYTDLIEADSIFASELLQQLPPGAATFDDARALLRSRILSARAGAPKDLALSIAELHLAWLRVAQTQGEGTCREVTSELFFDGAPVMRDDWARFEQGIGRQLMLEGALRRSSQGFTAADIPAWAYEAAREKSGLDPSAIRSALGSFSDPNRCTVEIALIEAMLERRADVTPAMLAAI